MFGFVYFGRSYTATASGSIKRRELCGGCKNRFEYEVKREVSGGAHSALCLNNLGAAGTAEERARENLHRALREAIEPVHCPTCGIFQPDMVRVLREQHGKRCEPNKYASKRVGVPMEAAWRAACVKNTKESYAEFMEVWPKGSDYAREKLSEIKYSPRLRRLTRRMFSLVWLAICLLLIIRGMYR